MMQLYLIALIALLWSEYGFRSRASALAGFEGRWRWRRSLLRLAIWAAAWLLAGLPPDLGLLPLLALSALLTEFAALWFRQRLRRELAGGQRHGSIGSHMLPLAVSLAGPLPFVIASWINIAIGPPILPIPLAALKITAGLLICWCWGTLLTVSVIDRVRPDEVEERPGRLGAGEVIGVVERALAFVLMLVQAPTAVAIGIAAKSAVRFPEFEDQAFAEYFLVGTLTSIGIGIAAAVLAGL